jgi:hypothetical protein
MLKVMFTKINEFDMTFSIEHYMICGEVVVTIAKLMNSAYSDGYFSNIKLKMLFGECLHPTDERSESFTGHVFEYPKQSICCHEASV